MRLTGVSSSNSITPPINDKDAKICALESISLMGLSSPLPCLLTESSELSPTIRISPKSAALERYVTCPLCRISKHPLVKTIFLPADLRFND